MSILVRCMSTGEPTATGRESLFWKASDGGLEISFAATILESIRFEVSRAGNGLGRIGIGGILLGVRTGAVCAVLEWVPIQCDHSRGPSFFLSRSDESKLSSLLDCLRSQEQATGRHVVGWFAAHPRKSLAMTRDEAELHQCRFPGKVALTMKPDQFGALQVAVHTQGDSGKASLALTEPVFTVEPLPIVRRDGGQRRRIETLETPVPVRVPVVPARAPHPPATSWRTPVLVAAALLGAVLVGAVAARVYRPPEVIAARSNATPLEMLSLHAAWHSGRAVVSWNGLATPITFATRVTLLLNDGRTTRRRVLSRADARAGVQYFRRTSPAIVANLVLETPSGEVVMEGTRLTAAGTAAPQPSRVTPEMLPPGRGRFQKF